VELCERKNFITQFLKNSDLTESSKSKIALTKSISKLEPLTERFAGPFQWILKGTRVRALTKVFTKNLVTIIKQNLLTC